MSVIEVAKAAGVSQGTVSRVINGLDKVSPSTAERVKKAMKEIGYVPPDPEHRRGPRRHLNNAVRTGNVAVVWFGSMGELASTHFVQCIESLSKNLTNQGFNTMIYNVNGKDPLPPHIDNDNIDGYIVFGGHSDSDFLNKLKKRPVVWLSSMHTSSGNRIICGNEAIGQVAASYLLDRGHRKLAVFNITPNHPGIKAREEAFKYTAFKAGVPVELFSSENDKYLEQSPKKLNELDAVTKPLVDKMIKSSSLPTGLFIPQDMVTAIVYRLLKREGIKIGKDIHIVSGDYEPPYLAGLDPRPTVVGMDNVARGRHAVEQLILQMQNSTIDRSIQINIEPIIIEGESA